MKGDRGTEMTMNDEMEEDLEDSVKIGGKSVIRRKEKEMRYRLGQHSFSFIGWELSME